MEGAMRLVQGVTAMVPDDPESNAVWLIRFTSIQFGISFFTSITRTDNNGALALLGLYASFGRKCEASKLYFVFLVLSCLTDLVWMVMYGNQISGAELQEIQNEWEDYAFPPVTIAKFVLAMSVIQFFVKVVSIPFTYKLFNNLIDDDVPSTLPRGGRPSYSASATSSHPPAASSEAPAGYQTAAKDEL
eukprot:CAMPEP_0196734408 /NCGR_PEP_ID=MMETSP1091-20130531/13163_1 /TAXON_ID=302021 /ORGANISM="Rhodomonas sp., Strain CCMP768" /LENGTH=188 /DNA_ID=CAMNT_0042077915 /DNA_START=11 /DNA_END=577 /DNA_ORIENTATION=+